MGRNTFLPQYSIDIANTPKFKFRPTPPTLTTNQILGHNVEKKESYGSERGIIYLPVNNLQ